jgi:ComF family protein
MLQATVSFLVRLLWPDLCVTCGVPVQENAFCPGCEISVLPLDAACRACAVSAEADESLCRACRTDPFPFSRARAALVYGGAAADAVVSFKHGRGRSLARPLGAYLVPVLDWAAHHGVEAVVPVPLHSRRLRSRGFNQALELARVAESFRRRRPGARRLPIHVDALIRRRDTPPLGHEPPPLRRRRVAGAFAVPRPRQVEGKRLLIVDDVMTTGATLAECARTLLQAGAREVLVAALARAL